MSHQESVELRLEELLADRSAEVSELAIEARRTVSKMAKTASEMLYKTYAVSNVFTYSNRLREAFIHIATYAEHVNLGFNYGVELDDPNEILEGTGKLIRHIRLESKATLRKRAVKALLKSAIQHGAEMAESAGKTTAQSFVDKTK